MRKESAAPAPDLRPPATLPRQGLCFERTALGDQQVRRRETLLPLHIARLLMLFESAQSVDDLRQMIDEPWLPEGLIELERRRLIRRVTLPLAPSLNRLSIALAQRRSTGESALEQRRSHLRIQFLRQLGNLGSEMARRIDECRSEVELNELMPQVDALIEAIAGREALRQFRAQSARSS